MKAAYHPEEVVATVRAAQGQYIAIFLGVLTLTYGFFVAIDFVPEEPDATDVASATSTPRGTEIAYAAEETSTTSASALASTTASSSSAGSQSEDDSSLQVNTDTTASATTPATDTTAANRHGSEALPVRIEIDALDRVVPVLNPTSRRVADLDAALLSGVVRHPDAANFNQDGNMFILGHSSRLPNVVNQNFQAFNDIETLQWGDTIRVYSADTVYVYRVEEVYEAKASTASVPIAGTGKKLTLATCNSFGSVDDRHIVEAKLMSQQTL